MEDQRLEFLQFAFRWFNCLLIHEIPFHLVTRLWDTYLAEGDALPDFLVYIFSSFLLTGVDEYKYLNQSNCYSITGVDDAKQFHIVKEALDVVHVSKEDQESVFAMLTTVPC
ncbi:hypothetical protein CRYUN_Cryun03dG0120400 [Craigia yunnanensis]